MDYAGGDVVHVSSGFSGLAIALYLGPRKIVRDRADPKGQNLAYTIMGACILWFGWLGFNSGSAGAADGRAGFAFLNTQFAASTGALTWMALDWKIHGQPHPLSVAW